MPVVPGGLGSQVARGCTESPPTSDFNDATMMRKSNVLLTCVSALAIAAVAVLRDDQVEGPTQRTEAVTTDTAGRDAMPAWVAYQYEQSMPLLRHGSWEQLFSSRW